MTKQGGNGQGEHPKEAPGQGTSAVPRKGPDREKIKAEKNRKRPGNIKVTYPNAKYSMQLTETKKGERLGWGSAGAAVPHEERAKER